MNENAHTESHAFQLRKNQDNKKLHWAGWLGGLIYSPKREHKKYKLFNQSRSASALGENNSMEIFKKWIGFL